MKMSVEEEVELRDLVAQTLELNGCLPKIRAQLRANLFLALDEDSKISKQQPLLNNKIKSHLQVPEGQLMFCLVREFLEYFDLDFTISVYEPESYVGSCYKYEGRQKVIEDLGLKSFEENPSGPVLLELVKIAQTKSKTLKINLTNINGSKVDDHETSGSISSASSVQNEINGHSNLSEDKENSGKTTKSKIDSAANESNENVDVDPGLVDKPLDSTYVKKVIENDDTFNGTSSIEEESVNGIDNGVHSHKNDEDENISSVSQESSPESNKSKLDDKSKTSQKSDKLKSKLELPPLQLNKSRGSDILPSLYTKEFKEKNCKDLDLDFDIKDDYEEDFMSGSEVEFSLSKVDCPKPLLEELKQYERSVNSDKHSSPTSVSSNDNILSNIVKEKNSKNSSSDNKVNSTTGTEDIETNLSVENEVATASSLNS